MNTVKLFNRFNKSWSFTLDIVKRRVASYYRERIFNVCKNDLFVFKLELYDLKQLTNTLKIRILSETSILYLIRYASVILIVGPVCQDVCKQANIVGRKKWHRAGSNQHCSTISRSSFRRSTICAIVPIRSTGFNLAKYRRWINIKRGCALRKRRCVILV